MDTKQVSSSKDKDDLFSNPMVKNALKGMSPEQLEAYQRIGERMYGSTDFTKGEIINNTDPPTEEKLSYIISGLKSGLSPKDMEKDELELMIEYYGDKWFEHFGISIDEIGEVAKSIMNEHDNFKKCKRNDKCPCGSGKKYKVCHLDKMRNIGKYLQQKPMNITEERRK